MATFAVIPSDPLAAYDDAGYDPLWLERYYNPRQRFERVVLLSPLEKRGMVKYGMEVYPTSPKELRRRLLAESADLVRAYNGDWACDMACQHRAPGVPVVVSVHTTKLADIHPSIRDADYVLCVSEAIRQVVLQRFPDPERAWVLYNRFDPAIMRPRPDANCADLNAEFPWRYRLLCVGRLSPQKNQDNLIRALAQLGPEYGCIFVGRNDPAEYQRLARKLGVLNQCRFIKSIPNTELARYYYWADAMVMPSRFEGFSIAIVEALACGAMVVTSAIAPTRECVLHGQNGLLIGDWENPQVIAAVVRSACTDKPLAKRLRTAAVASARRFSRETVDAQEIAYYNRILAERKDLDRRRGLLFRIKSTLGL